MEDLAAAVEKLDITASDVVLVHLSETEDAGELQEFAAQLAGVAHQTMATVLLLPAGVTVETIDDREMLARGWLRVGPLAHTSAQLAESTVPSPPSPTLSEQQEARE